MDYGETNTKSVGDPGAKGYETIDPNAPLDPTLFFPSSNQTSRSWRTPPLTYYTFVPTQTMTFNVRGHGDATTAVTSSLAYIGHGYVFDIEGLFLQEGQTDTLTISNNGAQITYTTGSGEVPTFHVGVERSDADFSFAFFNFDMLPTDTVQVRIDTVHNLLDIQTDTKAPSGNVTFDFELDRVNTTSSEVFHSPQGGFDLHNDATLLIDYSSWHGGTDPLRVGYDANSNGQLDADEVFTWEQIP